MTAPAGYVISLMVSDTSAPCEFPGVTQELGRVELSAAQFEEAIRGKA